MSYERILRRLLEYGALAPSLYNSQPWKFSMDSERGVIGLHPDEEKLPLGRELYLALGSCMEYMVVAAPALGYQLEETLFPRGEAAPAVLLKVKPLPEAVPESLFSNLLTRQTHAGKYLEGSVKEIHWDRLRNLPPFSSDEAICFLTEDGPRRELIQFLHDSSHESSGSQVHELAPWIKPQPDPLEGLTLAALGLPLSVRIRFNLLRYFAYQREILEVARQTLLRQGHGIEAPAYLLMTTTNPETSGYFNSGRWLARILLTLSEIELGSQILYSPVGKVGDHPRLKELFKAVGRGEPVVLLRVGEPEKKSWPRNGRRTAEQCLFTLNEPKKMEGKA